MRCASMVERAPEFAVLLCFDVTIDKDAETLAKEQGVTIFAAQIIYHLFDEFTAHQKKLLELKRKEAAGSAVFPCVLKIIQIFRTRDPIILGVDVMEGSIRIGTPIAAVRVNESTREKTIYSLGKMYPRTETFGLMIVRRLNRITRRWIW
jgi:translation initiation factor 5B